MRGELRLLCPGLPGPAGPQGRPEAAGHALHAQHQQPVQCPGKLSLPAEAGEDCTNCTDCTVCTVADKDDLSDILQLDGCDSVSTNSTDSQSDTSYTSDSPIDAFSDYSFDSEVSIDSDFSDYLNDSSVEVAEDQSEARIKVLAGPIRRQDDVAAPVWYEEYEPRPDTLPAIRKTVKRDNKYEKCGLLPTISVPNIRSFFP